MRTGSLNRSDCHRGSDVPSDLDRGGPLARRANTAGQALTRSGGAILRPQICGAVSKRGCNQIERKIIPNLLQIIQ
jgi:hypothetical protein